jgi:hypothetical protein
LRCVAGFSLETAGNGGRVEKGSGVMAFQGCGGAPVVGESVDEVLQLEEGTGEVRHGPKVVDEGGMGELFEWERNGDVVAQRRHGGGGPVDWRGHEAEERGEGGDGVLGRARVGGQEGKETRGALQ